MRQTPFSPIPTNLDVIAWMAVHSVLNQTADTALSVLDYTPVTSCIIRDRQAAQIFMWEFRALFPRIRIVPTLRIYLENCFFLKNIDRSELNVFLSKYGLKKAIIERLFQKYLIVIDNAISWATQSIWDTHKISPENSEWFLSTWLSKMFPGITFRDNHLRLILTSLSSRKMLSSNLTKMLSDVGVDRELFQAFLFDNNILVVASEVQTLQKPSPRRRNMIARSLHVDIVRAFPEISLCATDFDRLCCAKSQKKLSTRLANELIARYELDHNDFLTFLDQQGIKVFAPNIPQPRAKIDTIPRLTSVPVASLEKQVPTVVKPSFVNPPSQQPITQTRWIPPAVVAQKQAITRQPVCIPPSPKPLTQKPTTWISSLENAIKPHVLSAWALVILEQAKLLGTVSIDDKARLISDYSIPEEALNKFLDSCNIFHI